VPATQKSCKQVQFSYTSIRLRIYQVFANLLNNSIKFTKEGSIAIILQRKHDVNKEAVVSVKDTDIGIDTDILRRLFQGLLLNPRQLEQALVCLYQKILSSSWWQNMGSE
jgi:light-regulated signal transduction histidine kinase (bacteriophytochrome)